MNNQGTIGKLRAVSRLMFDRGPESEVSKRWLFNTSSKSDRRFKSTQKYSIRSHGEFSQITVGEEVFLWPAEVPLEVGLQMLSEIFTPTHPHQYQYGPTPITSEDVVMDIGACEGSFSALVSGRCRRVIAVEPSYSMCHLMEELFNLRKQTSPIIVNCFLGSEPSKAYFVDNASNPGASRMSFEPTAGAYEVPVQTLDQLVETLNDVPTFIKCDAEGAAPQIIAGGKKFLRQYRPKLAIASYHTRSEYRELHSQLKELGYNIMGKGFLFTSAELRVQMLHAW